MARREIPVLFCDTAEFLVDMSVRLARKHLEAPSSSQRELASAAGVESKSLSQTLRLFTAIDGVGPVTAHNLENEFPTVESLVEATPSLLMSVDGIGEETASDIIEALKS